MRSARRGPPASRNRKTGRSLSVEESLVAGDRSVRWENGKTLVGEFSVKPCRCADVAVLTQLAPNRDHLLS